MVYIDYFMKNDTIIYFGGGVNKCVFGAGIATGLQEADVYDCLCAVDGASGGAYNGAFLLAKQTMLGSRIYWEDLIDGFIEPSRLGKGSVVDIDHLDRIVREVKVLDVETIKTQSIPFWIKVLNRKTRKIEYLDGTEDTLNRLKFAVSAVPYYHASGQDFVDADITEPIGLESLLERHPYNKIVLAINHQPTRSPLFYVENMFHGIVGTFTHRDLPMIELFMRKAGSWNRDIKKAFSKERVLLVHPPVNSPTRACTKDPKKLKVTWEMGRREVEKIIRFMETA
jgi:predicted patatin/cPLA2 family phospholipase